MYFSFMGSDSDIKEENNKGQNINNFIPQQQVNSQPSNIGEGRYQFNPENLSENNSSDDLNILNNAKNENNFEEKDFVSKYNDSELVNMIQNYIDNFKILDSIYAKKEGSQDPVFDAINENQKNILIDYFRKNKNEIARVLLNFLNSRSLNVGQNLISDLLKTENGYSVYEKKVLREIAKINENKDLFKIQYLTILVIGKTGVGKSTLINCALKLEDNEKAEENETDSQTLEIKDYTSAKVPYLRLVDTRGLELGSYDATALVKDCSVYFNKQKNANDMNKLIHCIWYCVTGARLEKVEKQAIESLKRSYGISNIPIIIVYTQSNNKKLMDARKKNVQENNLANDYISILAREVEQPDGSFLKSFGLPELLEKTLKVCKQALNGDMHSLMTNNIAEYINNNLIKENSKINKHIKEKNILNFIKKYNNIKNKDEFQNYITNIYGNNFYYFLNKELSINGINVIKGSYLISIHNNNYIKYYQDIISQTISRELQNLSIKGVITQAAIEKKKGMSTLIQNKRDLDDFVKYNSKFLSDNFMFLAQKYYIEFILQKSCIEFSILLEQQLNLLISQILKHPNITKKISYLFQQRFKEFEEKIVNKSLAFNMPGNNGISSNDNNYQKKTSTNGRDGYSESNGKIVYDFKNSEVQSIKTENFSNLNSNFVNNNKNLKINNQPNFNQDMNSKKNIKALTDIKSTQTIMLNPQYQYNSNSSNSSKSQKNLIQYNNMNFQNKFPNNAQNPNKNINYYNGVYNHGYNPRF